jgi:hypothetical protein
VTLDDDYDNDDKDLNNNTCPIYCNHRIAAKLYTLETRFGFFRYIIVNSPQ